MGGKAGTPAERFSRWIQHDTNGGCWLWSGAVTSAGYGNLNCGDGKFAPAHKFSWLLHGGEEPDPGIYVCHKCDVRACCNPDHLFLGTAKENMADMAEKGRANKARGAAKPNCKLSVEDVQDIKWMIGEGLPLPEIAAAFDVRHGTVWAIKTGASWAYV